MKRKWREKTAGRLVVQCIFLFLIATVLTTILTSCNRGSGRKEPVTISFAYPMDREEYYQNMVERFTEEHPKITIELEGRSGDLLGGIGPGEADTFITSQFAQMWLRQENIILNLSSLAEQDTGFNQDDFYKGIADLFTDKGKVWSIPAGMDVMVMYYNKELFRRYGVPFPEPGWTWNEFLQAAHMTRDPAQGVFGYASTMPVFDAMAFIYQHGGRLFDDIQNPTKITFNDPQALEGLRWYADLTFSHNVAPTPAQVREEYGMDGMELAYIANGRAGMWSGMLSKNNNEYIDELETGIVALPRDRQAATLTLAQGYFINSRTEAQDACWTWLTFLSRQIPDKIVPVRKSILESKEYKRRVGDDYAELADSVLKDALLLSPELAQFEQAIGVFSRSVESIMRGNRTVEQAMMSARQFLSKM